MGLLSGVAGLASATALRLRFGDDGSDRE
jgi:hypothetical protein